MREGAREGDELERVQRQAMKMIKGRERLIYKTRLEEQYCCAWLRGSSGVGGQAFGRGRCEAWGPTDSEGPITPRA